MNQAVASSPCLELENVSISYFSNVAVRGVHMQIPRHQVTAFIGPCLLYTSPSPRDS